MPAARLIRWTLIQLVVAALWACLPAGLAPGHGRARSRHLPIGKTAHCSSCLTWHAKLSSCPERQVRHPVCNFLTAAAGSLACLQCAVTVCSHSVWHLIAPWPAISCSDPCLVWCRRRRTGRDDRPRTEFITEFSVGSTEPSWRGLPEKPAETLPSSDTVDAKRSVPPSGCSCWSIVVRAATWKAEIWACWACPAHQQSLWSGHQGLLHARPVAARSRVGRLADSGESRGRPAPRLTKMPDAGS